MGQKGLSEDKDEQRTRGKERRAAGRMAGRRGVRKSGALGTRGSGKREGSDARGPGGGRRETVKKNEQGRGRGVTKCGALPSRPVPRGGGRGRGL